MQKWQYLTLGTRYKHHEGRDQLLISIKTDEKVNFLPMLEGLNNLGQEGWEVCSMSGTAHGGDMQYFSDFLILLKRPILNE